MLKQEKAYRILLAKPCLINDTLGFQLYIFSRYLDKCGAPQLTKEQVLAYKEMGNPDNWSRELRDLRENNDKIKDLVSKESAQDSINKQRIYREKYARALTL